MKHTISQTRVKTKITQAYTDMLEQHAERIAQLKGDSQQRPPVRKRVSHEYSWATVSHPDYTLLVRPQDDIQFTSWVLPFEQKPPFASELKRTIVYLRLPFDYGTTVELTMNDNVYWATENQVMAAAAIESILYKDIIKKDDALIVPVVVVPFVHRFAPISAEDLANDPENEDDAGLLEAAKVDLQMARYADNPRLARAISFPVGLALLVYIDFDYRQVNG